MVSVFSYPHEVIFYIMFRVTAVMVVRHFYHLFYFIPYLEAFVNIQTFDFSLKADRLKTVDLNLPLGN